MICNHIPSLQFLRGLNNNQAREIEKLRAENNRLQNSMDLTPAPEPAVVMENVRLMERIQNLEDVIDFLTEKAEEDQAIAACNMKLASIRLADKDRLGLEILKLQQENSSLSKALEDLRLLYDGAMKEIDSLKNSENAEIITLRGSLKAAESQIQDLESGINEANLVWTKNHEELKKAENNAIYWKDVAEQISRDVDRFQQNQKDSNARFAAIHLLLPEE